MTAVGEQSGRRVPREEATSRPGGVLAQGERAVAPACRSMTGRRGATGPDSHRPSDSSSVLSKSLRLDRFTFLPLEWSASTGARPLITVAEVKGAFWSPSAALSETTAVSLTKKVSLVSLDSGPCGLSGNAWRSFPSAPQPRFPLLDSSESEKLQLKLASLGLVLMRLRSESIRASASFKDRTGVPGGALSPSEFAGAGSGPSD